MKRELRNYIATICIAICLTSFCINYWLFYQYFSTHPNHPVPEQNFVHQLNNHGSYVYLSDTESAGLDLLGNVMFIVFFLAVIIVPKTYMLPSASTPRWLTYVGGVCKTDLGKPSLGQWIAFAATVIIWLTIINFAGSSIVDFILSFHRG